jgi:hypothetical protein
MYRGLAQITQGWGLGECRYYLMIRVFPAHKSEPETDHKGRALIVHPNHGEQPGVFVHNPVGIDDRFDCHNRKQCTLAEACFLPDEVWVIQVIFRMFIFCLLKNLPVISFPL